VRGCAAPFKTLLTVWLLALLAFGCGGGGSSFVPPPPPPPPALAITTTSPLPEAIVGQAYNVALQASGGSPPYIWTIPPGLGHLPDGISLSSGGVLSGTPTSFAPGMAGGQFQVQDSKGATASAQLELIAAAPLTFSLNPALPNGNVAIPYSLYLSVTGGVQPFSFTLTAGSSPLPPGLALGPSGNSAGLVQGTPTTPGLYSFSVQVTDSGPTQMRVTQSFSLQIQNALVLPNGTLPDAVQNVAYAEYIKPGGGTPPYHFALGQNSTLPPGFSLDAATGKVSGTPTTSLQNTDFFMVTISDSAPTPATISPFVGLNIRPPLAFQTTSLPDLPRGLNYNSSIFIVGGRAPYTLQLGSGALPDGLSISTSSGFGISGVPTKDGTFQFTLKVSDSYETPNTANQNFQIRISDSVAIAGPGLVQILYNQSYSTTFPVTGGIPPYTWGMTPVPPGFSFDSATGTLSGTANGGSYTSPNVSVHDSSTPPQTATYFSFVLEVWGKLVIQTTSLPPVATGSSVWLQPLTRGGATPFQWSISSGFLPPGLSLGPLQGNGTIAITGSPTMAGTYNFTLAISDGNPGVLHQTVSQALTMVVKDRGQMTRNDTIATATPVSNISLLASISPYGDPSSAGPDVDYYSASAPEGTIVQVYVSPNNDFLQPPEPNSLQPVLEIVDSTGTRYQTCGYYGLLPGQVNNLPCINHLPGNQYLSTNYYAFQVPGSGTSPVTFFMRVLDARGDARPDFIYTFTVFGVN
jgi:putative Ig domain-containing protein